MCIKCNTRKALPGLDLGSLEYHLIQNRLNMATPKMQPFWWFLKPPCPSGEQLINPGFESPLSTGWTYWGASRSTDHVHSGAYACLLDGLNEYIQQVISTPIKVACISEFYLWDYSPYFSGSDPRVIVTYTDDITSDFALSVQQTWIKRDILSHLTPTKTVKTLYIRHLFGAGYDTYIDDVSLKGSGERI